MRGTALPGFSKALHAAKFAFSPMFLNAKPISPVACRLKLLYGQFKPNANAISHRTLAHSPLPPWSVGDSTLRGLIDSWERARSESTRTEVRGIRVTSASLTLT